MYTTIIVHRDHHQEIQHVILYFCNVKNYVTIDPNFWVIFKAQRCNDGSRDMRYKENRGHDKYDTDD